MAIGIIDPVFYGELINDRDVNQTAFTIVFHSVRTFQRIAADFGESDSKTNSEPSWKGLEVFKYIERNQ